MDFDVAIPFGRWRSEAERTACVSEALGRVSDMAIASRHLEQVPVGFTVDDILRFPNDGLRYELIDGMLILNPTAPPGFTADDLRSLEDDGIRCELIDGMLFVSPAPILRHQIAVEDIGDLLEASAPTGMRVFVSGVAWSIGEGTSLESDVVVVPEPEDRSDAAKGIVEPPMLAVEVLSPSTRRYDRTMKRSVYDEQGVGAYWIFDPVVDAPVIEVYERVAPGAPLELVARAEGEERLALTTPWPVAVVPADLLR